MATELRKVTAIRKIATKKHNTRSRPAPEQQKPKATEDGESKRASNDEANETTAATTSDTTTTTRAATAEQQPASTFELVTFWRSYRLTPDTEAEADEWISVLAPLIHERKQAETTVATLG
jgi:outer membrane biosynthesis protein TonB